jgi:hypothetical protein
MCEKKAIKSYISSNNISCLEILLLFSEDALYSIFNSKDTSSATFFLSLFIGSGKTETHHGKSLLEEDEVLVLFERGYIL